MAPLSKPVIAQQNTSNEHKDTRVTLGGSSSLEGSPTDERLSEVLYWNSRFDPVLPKLQGRNPSNELVKHSFIGKGIVGKFLTLKRLGEGAMGSFTRLSRPGWASQCV